MSEKWELTEHACRVCMGRVLLRNDVTGKRVAHCPECGATGEDAQSTLRAIHSICACGTKRRGGKDAGHRCIRNPNIRPEFPMIIIVALQEEGVQ